MTLDEVEVRTTSVPASAHLLLAGFKPLGVMSNGRGGRIVRFPPDARAEHDRFIAAKAQIDQMFDQLFS